MEDYDGVLEDWYTTPCFSNSYKGYVLFWGNIHNDRKGRFPQGHFIHTSYVIEHQGKREGDVVQTLNSRYKLGRPLDEVPAA